MLARMIWGRTLGAGCQHVQAAVPLGHGYHDGFSQERRAPCRSLSHRYASVVRSSQADRVSYVGAGSGRVQHAIHGNGACGGTDIETTRYYGGGRHRCVTTFTRDWPG